MWGTVLCAYYSGALALTNQLFGSAQSNVSVREAAAKGAAYSWLDGIAVIRSGRIALGSTAA